MQNKCMWSGHVEEPAFVGISEGYGTDIASGKGKKRRVRGRERVKTKYREGVCVKGRKSERESEGGGREGGK